MNINDITTEQNFITLSMDDLKSIEGGNKAYDLGHDIGEFLFHVGLFFMEI